MTVKEPAPRTKRRFLRRRAIVASFVAVIGLVVVLQLVVLPWLVRGRVRAVLGEAGFDRASFRVTRATLWASELRDVMIDDDFRIDRVGVSYAFTDLWHRQVGSIEISGARIPADAGKRSRKQASTSPATPTKEVPADRATQLPFDKLTVATSEVVLSDGTSLPLSGVLEARAGGFTFRLQAADGLRIDGTEASFHAASNDVPADLIMAAWRTYQPDVPLELAGVVGGSVDYAKETGLRAKIELSGGGESNASDAKLRLTRGVFEGEATFASAGMTGTASTRPAAFIRASGVDLSTPQLSAQGVSGSVTLSHLAPPATPGAQKLAAAKVKIGNLEFTNGFLDWDVQPTGDIIIRDTQWHWLGGQVAARDVTLPRGDGPVQVTLHAHEVDLRQLLELLAKDKASGEGRLSGSIPVTIDGSRIEFGDAIIAAVEKGQLQIKDAAAIAPTAEAAAQAANDPSSSERIKRNIIEALGDFQFDRLTARLVNDPAQGLVGHVRMTGRGRTGARQKLDYELNLTGLDQALRLYTGLSAELNKPQRAAAATTAEPTTANDTGSTTRKAQP